MAMPKMADSNLCMMSQLAEKDIDVRNVETLNVIDTVTNGGENNADSNFAASGDLRNTASYVNSCKNESITRPSQPSEKTNYADTHSWHKPLQFLRRRRGLGLALIASIGLSLQSIFMDILVETIDSFQIVFMYVPILVIFCLVLIIHKGVRPSKYYRHYLRLIICGTCQAGTSCCFSLSLAYLAAGDAVSILYTSLIQVGFFSWIILKEPIRMFDAVFAILAFGGVVFIARPAFIFQNLDESSTYQVTPLGVLICLAGSCTFAVSLVLNRSLSMLGVDSFFCMFFIGTVIVCVSGFMSVILNRWRCPTSIDWLYTVLAGVTYAASYFCVFYALKMDTATDVTVFITAEIVWTFLWQLLFLRMPPFWTSYVGAILIMIASIGITLKNKPRLPQSRDNCELGNGPQCQAII